MNEVLVRRVALAYGLRVRRILPAQKGYRNTAAPVELADGSWVNILFFKHEPDVLVRIQRANAVMNYAAAAGLPVRRALHSQIAKLSNTRATKYAALYNFLPGQTIPWEAYTKHHLKLAGMAMSSLHEALRTAPSVGLPSAGAEYLQLLTRMQRYFAEPQVARALQQKCGLNAPPAAFLHLQEILKLAADLPRQQPLHLDFVRGNLLFRPAERKDIFTHGGVALSGIIDFEKTALGHPVLDAARTLAFLLVDCKHKTPEAVQKYFLKTGYNKHGPQRLAVPVVIKNNCKTNLLNELTSFFLLHDFYKFLRHNPYEFLHQNEHFVRTRNMLLAKKMLEYNKPK